MIALFAHSQ